MELHICIGELVEVKTWDKAITLYSRYNGDIVTWKRIPISGCFWCVKNNKILSGNEIISNSSIDVRVPCSKLSTPIKTGDIIVCDYVADEIPDNTDGSNIVLAHPGCSFIVHTAKSNIYADHSMTNHYYGSDV